jgi:8-amino-7-oxononanoate synthase
MIEELHDLDDESLRRKLRIVDQTNGSHITIDGQERINWASNNYLGLARHPNVIQAANEALATWGASAASSRLLSGTSRLHQDLEKKLAEFLKADAALLFPTGYMTNVGVLSALVGPGDAVIIDRLSHASLIDAVRLSGARLFVYPHSDCAGAEKALARAQSYRRRILVTESLYSMDGDIAPLRELADLTRRYGAIGFLDEAHALGVWGFQGRGVLGLEGMDDKWDIVVGTLSKALGSQGGFVAGSAELIDLILNKARSFIFTTGLSPVCVAAAQAALELIQSDPTQRVQVQKVSAHLREALRLQGWAISNSSTQIVPIILGDPTSALACAEFLSERGFYAPAIRPPTVPAGECRVRFSVTAEHRVEEVDQLLAALSEFRSR